ncbi:MAG: QueT transporter family protein [Clostridia bacterium]|nr:QueT transporter family protein [Clostridia bacterium]
MKSKRNTTKRVRFICLAAIIAAMYVALTYLSMALGLDKNAIQIRFSEMLVALAFVTPAAIPGLYVGCLLANILTACAPLDILLGPIATLIGATGAYLIGKMNNRRVARWLCTLPNMIANVIIVTVVCYVCYTAPDAQSMEIIPFYAATVALGEIVSCGIFGTVLLLGSEKTLRRLI